jgi:hypothetical protein
MNAPAPVGVARPVSQLMHELIAVAERLLYRPAPGHAERLGALQQECRARVTTPYAGARLQWEDALLAATLARLDQAQRFGEPTTRPATVAGVLLPMVRENLFAALRAEQAATVETTSTGRNG